MYFAFEKEPCDFDEPPPEPLKKQVVDLTDEQINVWLGDEVEHVMARNLGDLKQKCAKLFKVDVLGFTRTKPDNADPTPVPLLTCMPKPSTSDMPPSVYLVPMTYVGNDGFQGTPPGQEPNFQFRSPIRQQHFIGSDNNREKKRRTRKNEIERKMVQRDEEENRHGEFEASRHKNAKDSNIIRINMGEENDHRRSFY